MKGYDGSTAYGMGSQVRDDARKHGIPLLLAVCAAWSSYMGHLIYNDCKRSLKRPMQLLSRFEQAGKLAEKEERFLTWTTPIVKFPVVQHYVVGVVKKIAIQYGPPAGDHKHGLYDNTYQLFISFLEETTITKRKQSSGAAPNAVHSLDATHLIMVVNACDFDTVTVHDSFGCHACDMSDLFRIVREQLVELYRINPLDDLIEQIGGDLKGIKLGTLNVEDVLKSEYAFA